MVWGNPVLNFLPARQNSCDNGFEKPLIPQTISSREQIVQAPLCHTSNLCRACADRARHSSTGFRIGNPWQSRPARPSDGPRPGRLRHGIRVRTTIQNGKQCPAVTPRRLHQRLKTGHHQPSRPHRSNHSQKSRLRPATILPRHSQRPTPLIPYTPDLQSDTKHKTNPKSRFRE